MSSIYLQLLSENGGDLVVFCGEEVEAAFRPEKRRSRNVFDLQRQNAETAGVIHRRVVGSVRKKDNEDEKQDPEVNDASSSHFFIFHFFTTFSFFHSPSSSPLIPPSSLFLFLPRPALSVT